MCWVKIICKDQTHTGLYGRRGKWRIKRGVSKKKPISTDNNDNAKRYIAGAIK